MQCYNRIVEFAQKKTDSDFESHCRKPRQLIDRACGGRDIATFARLYERLKSWNAKIFFSGNWNVNSDIIPSQLLLQTKRKSHLIESNNMPQRHWFACFRRKTVCVSRSLEMIDLATMLYAKFHVNGTFNYAFCMP
jgi:insertion element IS1 protein InsB